VSTVRKDSWAGELLPDEAAEVFDAWRKYKGSWEKFADWIAETFEKARKPSRTALYAWASTDPEHPGAGFQNWKTVRSARIRAAGEQMAEWARAHGDIADETVAKGFMALGCDAMSNGGGEAGKEMLDSWCKVTDRLLHRQELNLKRRAQQTKDEQLKLAREKFEAARKRLERVAEIADAARGGKVDPAKVADEIDRILGRKK